MAENGQGSSEKALLQTLYVRYNVRMSKFMTVTEARKKIYQVVEEAKHPGVAVVLTHEGIPEVVVMSFEEYEGWQETMEIMSDPELEAGLREGVRQMKAGEVVDLETVRKRFKL